MLLDGCKKGTRDSAGWPARGCGSMHRRGTCKAVASNVSCSLKSYSSVLGQSRSSTDIVGGARFGTARHDACVMNHSRKLRVKMRAFLHFPLAGTAAISKARFRDGTVRSALQRMPPPPACAPHVCFNSLGILFVWCLRGLLCMGRPLVEAGPGRMALRRRGRWSAV